MTDRENRHNPEVGYCQGMNLVAGTLLLTLPTEEDAFWVLCCIIEVSRSQPDLVIAYDLSSASYPANTTQALC